MHALGDARLAPCIHRFGGYIFTSLLLSPFLNHYLQQRAAPLAPAPTPKPRPAAPAPAPSRQPHPDLLADFPTVADLVGNTPIVRLQHLPGDTTNVILAKLEGHNPAGSAKDRPALHMLSEAERRGHIRKGDTIIEATSGNTGIALAMAAAIKGERLHAPVVVTLHFPCCFSAL